MSAKFVAEEGILKGVTLPLEGGTEWVLGRDPDESQIILEDPSVSRKHLVLRISPEGIVAENLSETSPIFINDEQISEPRLLNNGDSVKIGDGYYRYFSEETEETAPVILEETFEEEAVAPSLEVAEPVIEEAVPEATVEIEAPVEETMEVEAAIEEVETEEDLELALTKELEESIEDFPVATPEIPVAEVAPVAAVPQAPAEEIIIEEESVEIICEDEEDFEEDADLLDEEIIEEEIIEEIADDDDDELTIE